jgi:hypothetical protein
MAAALDQSNRELSYIVVDRTAQRVMAPGGLKYWLWIAFCAFRHGGWLVLDPANL